MPPLPIDLTIQAGIPWLSGQGRAVISALVAADGQIDGADAMAARIRIGDRFRLARLLRRDGLPSFGRLADWIFVLQALWEAEAKGVSLLRVARGLAIEPATCYRRCRRVLGVPWRSARANGFAWALVRFFRHCHRPADARGTGRSGRPGQAGTPQSAPDMPRAPRAAAGVVQGREAALVRPLRPVARIMVDQAPTDAAVSASGAVYVTRAFAAAVEHLDIAARRAVATIPVGVNPTRIVFDGSAKRAYVSNQFGGSISVIDATTDAVVDEIPVPADPVPLAVGSDRRTLYVTTNLDRLYSIDLQRKRITAEAPLPATSHHIALHPDRRRLFVATRSAGGVLELDARTLEVTRFIRVGGYVQAIAVEAHGDELFVANEAGWVDVLSLRTGEVTASMRLSAGAYGICLSPDTTRLHVTLPSTGQVAVLDRTTLRRVHTIATGGTPRHTVFLRDGRTAVIVNEAGWLDVVTA